MAGRTPRRRSGITGDLHKHLLGGALTALALGVPPERISTIAAGPNPPGGVRPVGAIDARPDALERITDAILAGELTVPVAAVFPVEQIRDAVTVQAGRRVHGKVVVTL